MFSLKSPYYVDILLYITLNEEEEKFVNNRLLNTCGVYSLKIVIIFAKTLNSISLIWTYKPYFFSLVHVNSLPKKKKS